ncbi:CLUMA_CG008929, isoform A [Clunio marinus]|uniref:CLUMA_CG008929, isoform A n=1 Tax=Clunio marinus TaxID=568069 RepID=A0A1J1I7A3_9DIPT|nr:CLUMA_CG008929, isoform A [Clunio marinus]
MIEMTRIVEVLLFASIVIPTLINSLANCPNGCLCNDETLVVTCYETNLDVMPIALNPSIKQLIMKNNKIKSIESAIQFYPDIEFLDLSGNHLLKIPSRTFQYQRRLKEMRLNNNKIGQIEPETFHGMESIQILNLRGNLIDLLEHNSFSSLLNLEELNLGQNRIAEIKSDAFYRLYNLKILYLDDNTLSHVPAESFLPLTSLAELFIGVNSFTTLEKSSFEKLKKLTTLNLNGAQLDNISSGAFTGLDNLRVLDLSSNRLARIPTKEVSGLHRLEELSIGMNDFEIIPEKAFEGLTNLHQLEIIGANKLVRVQNNAFIDNGNLRIIRFISNEELSQFESAAFHGLPFLKELILRNNAIESIRENLYEWDNLQVLDLSENPLRCDCHLLWYKTFLNSRGSHLNSEQQRNSININNNSNSNVNHTINSTKMNSLSDSDNSSIVNHHQHIICASPAYAKGKEFRKLSSDLFGCTPNSDPKIQAIICGLLVITAATITTLILIAYKCRRRKFRNVLKDSGWDISSTIGRKDRDYHKTYAAPQYIDTMRKHTLGATISSPSHCNSMTGANNYQQYPLTPMIPITEL